jgi:uncharacterized protein (DUF885 family)
VQGVRDGFDLMPTKTAEHWSNIAGRLSAVPQALAGYTETLRAGIASGRTPARRQVELAVAETAGLADPEASFFTSFVAGRPPRRRPRRGRARRGALSAAPAAARDAYGALSAFLRDRAGPGRAAGGRRRAVRRYQRASRVFLGATIDLDETYEWGVAELARVTAEQEELAPRDRRPRGERRRRRRRAGRRPGPPARRHRRLAQAWMQTTKADEAIAEAGRRPLRHPRAAAPSSA